MNPCPKKYPHKAATGVVYGQDSRSRKSIDNLSALVASLIHDSVKAFAVHVHR